MDKLLKFLKDEDGVTAIEYGLIAALIACMIITVITAIGTNLAAKFTEIKDALTPGAPAAA